MQYFKFLLVLHVFGTVKIKVLQSLLYSLLAGYIANGLNDNVWSKHLGSASFIVILLRAKVKPTTLCEKGGDHNYILFKEFWK